MTQATEESPVSPEVLARLRRSAQKPHVDELAVLDKLDAPKNLQELQAFITDPGKRMFFPMAGVPRAYMEFPLHNWNERGTERWVYSVLCARMRGSAKTTEGPLCSYMWDVFKKIRRYFAAHYGDMEPLLVWRRQPEFEQSRDELNRRYYHIYMRLAIPGLDLPLAMPQFFSIDSVATPVEVYR